MSLYTTVELLVHGFFKLDTILWRVVSFPLQPLNSGLSGQEAGWASGSLLTLWCRMEAVGSSEIFLPNFTASQSRKFAQRSKVFVTVYELSFIMLAVIHMTIPCLCQQLALTLHGILLDLFIKTLRYCNLYKPVAEVALYRLNLSSTITLCRSGSELLPIWLVTSSAYIPYSEKIRRRLMRSPCCLCVYSAPISWKHSTEVNGCWSSPAEIHFNKHGNQILRVLRTLEYISKCCTILFCSWVF
jgi:hypothetical protein